MFEFGRRATIHQLSAIAATTWPDVNDVVGPSDDRLFVFDDDEGVSLGSQCMHDIHEPSGVARVQTDSGFVHDKERVDERSSKAGREVDPFNFAAGKGSRRTIQSKVSKSHFI